VRVKCKGCGNIIVDTEKKICRIVKDEDYEIELKWEFGTQKLNLVPVSEKYVCMYCGREINIEVIEKRIPDIRNIVENGYDADGST